MKISQFTPGGIQYTPSSYKATASTKSSGTDTSDLAKELIDQIQATNGLDSDVQAFITFARNKIGAGYDINGSNLTLDDVFQIQAVAKKVKNNADTRDKAVERLVNQDAWGEVAMTTSGGIYVYNNQTKKVEVKSLEQLKNNQKKYTVMDNQTLLQMRETGMAFQQNVLYDIAHCVGMNAITDQASKIIKEFGQREQSSFVTNDKTSKLQNGFNQLLTGGPDGVYKITKKTRFGSDSNEELAAATKFIFSSLPATYQRALQVKAYAEGTDPLNMLGMLIQATSPYTFDASFESSASNAAGYNGGGEGGVSGSVATSIAEMYATGVNGGPLRQYDITPSGASAHMFVWGRTMGKVLKSDEKTPMNMATIQYIMDNSANIGAVSMGAICFGDRILDKQDLSAVVYDQSDMRRVEMPYKVVNGNIVPDFTVLDKIEKVNEYLKDNSSSMSGTQIQELLNKEIPGAKWDDQNKTITYSQTKAFLTFGAYGNSEAMNADIENSKYLSKVDKDDAVKIRDGYIAATEYGSIEHTGDKKHEVVNGANWDFWNTKKGSSKHDMYRGNVFIALNDPIIGSAMSNRQIRAKSEYQNMTQKSDLHDERSRVRTQFD